MGRNKRQWAVYFMCVLEMERMGLFKVGMSSDVGERIRSLNRPFYTHELLWKMQCRNKRHARAVELAIMESLSDCMLPRTRDCDNTEYGASPDVVSSVRMDPAYLDEVMSRHGPDGPTSLDAAIASGHVCHRGKISIYDYESADGEGALAIFRRHAAMAGADVPESMLYFNPARPRKMGNSEWTAWTAPPLHVRHGPRGRHSRALMSELNSYRTTWRREGSRKSEWTQTGAGSKICNQQIFLRYLAKRYPMTGQEKAEEGWGEPASTPSTPRIPSESRTS